MLEYQSLSEVTPLIEGEINVINHACGNGWRKVFNVYAKLLYALDKKHFDYSDKAPTWQGYRDKHLFQTQSKTALLFSTPKLIHDRGAVHVICGKGHAKALINSGELDANLIWLDDEFAIDKENKLLVCPYFDYRQLSNIKIERLAGLLQNLKTV